MIKCSAILVALIATFSLNSNAVACHVNGNPVPGEPLLIEGTGGPDVIDCRDSTINLEIYGYGGDDTIYGGEGHDFIAGGSGRDEIYGGIGNDAIDGGGNDDTIYGGVGHDLIFGGVGASPASGVGCGQESAFIALGSSYLTKGGSGDDIIFGGDGDDCIDAGSGEDTVFGGPGNDILEGGNHSDFIDGGLGDDFIDGGWHSDTCMGGGGNDTITNCEPNNVPEPFCGDGNCSGDEDSCNCQSDCNQPPVNEINLCYDNLDNDCDMEIDCDDIADCGLELFCINNCIPLGNLCEMNSDCCSNKCKGKQGSKTCK